MLVELQSDAFKDSNKIRETITFHAGINAVVAKELANNSIGKTSFLLAIDFAFGGEAYVSDDAGIVSGFGHHTLNFAFDFGNGKMLFSRSTETPDIVNVCGKDYRTVTEQLSVKDYCARLATLYGVENLGMTFRETVSPYIRISHKSPKDLNKFLKSDAGEPDANGVERVEKLFEKRSLLSDETKKFDDASKLSDTFSTAQKLNLISGGSLKKKEIEEVTNQIKELEAQNETLTQHSDNEQLAKLDKEHAERAASIQGQLQPLRAKRTRLLNKIEYTRKTIDGLCAPTKQELLVLQTFFPDANIKKLYAVEEFHNSLSSILKEELAQNLAQFALDLQNVDTRIAELEKALQSVAPGNNLPKAAYIEYAQKFNTIQKLQEKLENFHKGSDLKTNTDAARQNLFNKEIDILNGICTEINSTMADFNQQIQDGKWTNPEIAFALPQSSTAKGISHYSLTSKSDRGDGTEGADVLLYDLAVLQLTRLPILIHDGFIRTELDSEREQAFIKLFAGQGKKQIFTEFNATVKYNEEIQKLLDDHISVLEIGTGEKGLYGRSIVKK